VTREGLLFKQPQIINYTLINIEQKNNTKKQKQKNKTKKRAKRKNLIIIISTWPSAAAPDNKFLSDARFWPGCFKR